MLERIKEDIQTVFDRDPAAKSTFEVLTCYPGLHAIWLHRIAHRLYNNKHFTLARLLSHFNRLITGIEIHPGATLGRKVFIDHGMGIVIGETAQLGDECLIYKGVVLGGVSLEKKKRHPTLGVGVVVGSNACILGAIEIGDHARIGSGSVVISSVPAEATCVGIPGRVVKQKREAGTCADLAHNDLPDPMIEVVEEFNSRIEKLETRLRQIENNPAEDEPAED